MTTAQFKALSVIGIVTDGPMRDYMEIKEMKVQHLATGLTSGHDPLTLRGVDILVKVAGMTVASGDIAS
jgi:regulator of RNase E activity RraA